jgi:hypothetical protein
VEDILDDRGKTGPMCECLVSSKDFDVSHDSWVRRKLLTLLVLQPYDQFLTEHVRFCEEHVKNSKLPSLVQNLRLVRVYLSSFTGYGRYSVFKDSNSLPSSVTNSPIVATSKTSDVEPITYTVGEVVVTISTSSGRVIRRPTL